MKKILVTGAAGFIGSQLAYKLWKNGDEIILIDNFSYGKMENLVFEDCDFRDIVLTVDIRDKDKINELFSKSKFDVVYHFAAISILPDCQNSPKDALEVNVGGTINILEASRIYGVIKVIFASTSAVYENSREFPSAETSKIYPSLIYPNTKLSSELFCRAYSDAYGMNIACLRFSNVYGPHIDCLRNMPSVAAYIIKELYYGNSPTLYSSGEQKRDFIFVNDVINLAILAQHGEGFDIVNVSSNEAYSINDMYRIISEIMEKENIIPKYSEVAGFWTKYSHLYEGAFTISHKILDNEVNKFTLLDNRHAKAKYGWEPIVNFIDGLKITVEYTSKVLKEYDNFRN